ncbi:MAG: hypothetical protein JW857_04875 [Bacteroidales bacterium]|nr:hypothetical protein [Bacteroidales bacterium]
MDTKIKVEHKEEGIELLALVNIIKIKKRIVFISVGIAFVLALLLIILTPKEYKTQMSLLAESNSKGAASGLLGQLGGLTGGNLGSLMGLDLSGGTGSDALTPDLYPNIVKSTTFLMEILGETIIEPDSQKKITVAEYLSDYTRPSISGIPGYLLNLIKSSDEEDYNFRKDAVQPLKLSLKQESLVEALSGLIEVDVIKSGGGLTGGESKIINVSIEIQDPYLSAVLAELVVSNLKMYIINYNTGKAKQDLEFIEARYLEARERYYKTQQALADYDDSNINVILASVRTNRQRLETENSLASGLYNGLAQKLEQSKIIVQDRTPVFTVIEPAKVPLRKSKPKASLILIGMLFVGVFVGVSIILGQEFVKSYSLGR